MTHASDRRASSRDKDRRRRAGLPKAAATAASALIFVLVMASQGRGQPDEEGDAGATIFLQAPREMRVSLGKARQAIDEARYDDAVAELVELLGDETSEDFFDSPTEIGRPSTGIKAAVHKLLGALPARGREAYELRFGDEAGRLLKQAARSGNTEGIAEVARSYFHTEAGSEAAIVLGRRRLEQNQPLAGALLLRRLAETSSAAEKYEPELSLLLATCWLRAGADEEAGRTLMNLKSRFPRARPRVGAAEATWDFNTPTEAIAWLTRVVGRPPEESGYESADWLMYRGDAERNARSSGGMPMASVRWQVPTAIDPTDQRLLSRIADEFRNEAVPATPSVHPLVVSGMVLMRSPSELIGVDFATGKRIWQYPFDGGAMDGSLAPRGRSRASGESAHQQLLEYRMWNDSPYGQLSSDGKRVFMLDQLDSPSTGAGSPRMNIRFGGAPEPNRLAPKDHNQLVSVDLATQGKLNWIVGGETGEDEPRLASAFFLGAPLPLDGKLYAIAEIRGEIRLVVLDAASGRLEWSQQLAHVDSFTIVRDRGRRVAGATPSFGEGVLICPTSAGAVVAVDVAARSLLWGQTYPSNQQAQAAMGLWQAQTTPLAQQGERFSDATATIADGRVILTPQEADSVFCFDLISGELKWRARRSDGDLLFVAAVQDGNVVLVGKHDVRALKLADGQEAWRRPASLERVNAEGDTADGHKTMPSGRGFATGPYYYLPTTASEILKIDMRDGAIAARNDTDAPLGNLACHQGHVVSHAADRLAVFYQQEPLREEVSAILKRDPQNAWALARRGELLLHEGRWQESLRDLKQAYQREPENDDIHSLLIKALLAALRADFDANLTFALDAAPLIRQPDTLAEFRRQLAEGYERSGRLEQAVEALVGLADLQLQTSRSDHPADALRAAGDGWMLRTDRWVRSKLAALSADSAFRSGASGQFLDQAASQRASQVLSLGDIRQMQWFLDYFGFHSSADAVRLALAEAFFEAEEDLQAELAAAPLLASTAPEVSARAVALTAKICQRTERRQAAAAHYARLLREFPQTVCWQGKTGEELVAGLLPDSPIAQRLSGESAWRSGPVEVDVNSDDRLLNFDELEFIHVRHGLRPGVRNDGDSGSPSQSAANPPPADQVGLAFALDGDRSLIVADEHGRELTRIGLPMLPQRNLRAISPPVQGMIRSGLLVLLLDWQLLAIDLPRALRQEECLLWSRDLTNGEAASGRFVLKDAYRREPVNRWGIRTPLPADSQGRKPAFLAWVGEGGVCYFHQSELVCLDLITGERIWQRSASPNDGEAFGDDRHICIATANGADSRIYRTEDGAMVGSCALPGREKRWLASRGRVLAWEESQDSLTLRIVDAISGSEVWSRQFPGGTKACLGADDSFAAMSPDGRFVWMPIFADSAPVETQFAPEKTIDSLRLISFNDARLVVVETPPGEERADVTVSPAPPSSRASLLFSGRIYALEPTTGTQIWEQPLVIDRHGLLLNQPAGSPLLFFLRHVTPKQATQAQRQRTSVMVVDRRSGQVVFTDDEVRGGTPTYTLTASPSSQTVSLRLPMKSYNFRLTEK